MSEPYSPWDQLEDSDSYQGVALWPWQRAALSAWKAAGRKGVVEAVAGTGKSLAGAAAIHSALERAISLPLRAPVAKQRRKISAGACGSVRASWVHAPVFLRTNSPAELWRDLITKQRRGKIGLLADQSTEYQISSSVRLKYLRCVFGMKSPTLYPSSERQWSSSFP